MSISNVIKRSTIAAGALSLISLSVGNGVAKAASIVNGGFESDLSGWTVVKQSGSSGNVFQTSGGFSPITGNSILAASEGTGYAVTDQGGPGSYVLFQDISLEAGKSHSLSFDWFAKSWASLSDAGTMNKDAFPNQQFRVDLVSTNFTDWFGPDSSAGVLTNLIAPVAESPVWNSATFDLTAWAGQDVRLAFRQADNQFFFQAGVDNVGIESVSESVPEPASVLGLLAAGALGATSLKRKQKEDN